MAAEKALGEIAEYLRQTKTGEMTPALAINYIDLSVKIYQEKKPNPMVQEQLEARRAMSTYYGGANPLD